MAWRLTPALDVQLHNPDPDVSHLGFMASEIWLLPLVVSKADRRDWRICSVLVAPWADEKLKSTGEIQAHSQTIPVMTHSFDLYR